MRDYWQIITLVAKSRGISFKQISKTLGKNPTYLSSMKAYNRSMSCDLLNDISKILNVSTDYLLNGKERIEFDRDLALKMIYNSLLHLSEYELKLVEDVVLLLRSNHPGEEENIKADLIRYTSIPEEPIYAETHSI